MCPRGRPRGQGRPRGLHLREFYYIGLNQIYIKMCPRGRPRGQGRPRGLHLREFYYIGLNQIYWDFARKRLGPICFYSATLIHEKHKIASSSQP